MLIQIIYWITLFIILTDIVKGIAENTTDTLPTLGICLISRNDNLDIKEWLDYHKSIGVKGVMIIDNNSTHPLLNEVHDYVKSGFVVDYFFFAKRMYPNNQFWAYTQCLKSRGRDFDFMAFIDSDEFIVVGDKSKRITEVLKEYMGYGGLTLNWLNYNSNGYYARPPGGVIPNYSKCYKEVHVKSIVETKYTEACLNPHYCAYKPGYRAIDTNRSPVTSAFNPANHSEPDTSLYKVLHINHYNLKSYEDFRTKMKRGSAAFSKWKKDARYFCQINAIPSTTCDVLSFGKF